MPHEAAALLGILAALSVGVVSPGPSFVMIARMAVATSRPSALAASLGMGLGGALFAIAALLGLQAVFHAWPVLYVVLKACGGLYLGYLGLQIFRHAAQPLDLRASGAASTDARRSFWLGFSTQVSNPKTSIVYASVFAAFLPPKFSLAFAVALVALVFCVEASWYALVAVALSADAPQKAYLARKVWVDRVAGSVLFALGIALVAGAMRP